MRYGFTDGGFQVVDDAKRIGEFAFWSSPYWERACRNPEKTALEMLAKSWAACPDELREKHYQMSCEALNHATRWPKRLANA